MDNGKFTESGAIVFREKITKQNH